MTTVAAAAPLLVTETWAALGTTVVLRYPGPRNADVHGAVQAELDAIDLAASRFRDDSELARLNASSGAAVTVSPLLGEAVGLALRAAELTDGAVDPTLGANLVSLGYDRDFAQLPQLAEAEPPEPPEPPAPLAPQQQPRIIVRRRRASWRDIELGDDGATVRLPPGISLDLGATAKALAADRAARAARRAHPSSGGVLVALGGDLAVTGPAPGGGWLVHVTDDHRNAPDAPDAPGQTVTIEDGGLATSSVLARRWRHDGQTMHHILDPRDGRPTRSPWRTVSVAAASCADANIAATAAIVLGAGAPGWLARQSLPARLVGHDGTVQYVGGWGR